MLNEEEIKEISSILKQKFSNKFNLRNYLANLSINIPKYYSYKKIIQYIEKNKLEVEVCKYFRVADFNDLIRVKRNEVILSFFSSDEMENLYKKLKDNFNSSFKKINYNKRYVSRNFTEDQIINIYIKIFTELHQGLLVRKHNEWVIGPLGLLKSPFKLNLYESERIVELLSKYIHNPKLLLNIIEDFKELNLDEISLERPFLKEKIIQLILSYQESYNDILNKIVQLEKIEINDINIIDDELIITPYGIFEREYEGFNNLVNVLLKNFSEEDLDMFLKREKIVTGDIENRIKELCLLKNPKNLIEMLFGKGPHLIKLASDLNLKFVNHIQEKDNLTDVILLKLGFNLPPDIKGLHSYNLMLKDFKNKLLLETEEVTKMGIWNKIYSETEKLLRDFIYYFFSAFWEEELSEFWEDDDVLINLKYKIKNEFKIKKPIEVLTLSELCILLQNVNDKIKGEEEYRKAIKKLFNKNFIISSKDVKLLRPLINSRTILTKIHPSTKRRNIKPDEIISKVILLSNNWLNPLNKNSNYPIIIRIKEEIENEYGISYINALDETGRNFIIKKTEKWIQSTYSYFMPNSNNRVVIEPILVKKIW